MVRARSLSDTPKAAITLRQLIGNRSGLMPQGAMPTADDVMARAIILSGSYMLYERHPSGPPPETYEAIRLASASHAKVDEYAIRAITSGSKAMGEVTVRVSEDGLNTRGRGVSTDVVEASAKAYIDALNRLAVRAGVEKSRTQTV